MDRENDIVTLAQVISDLQIDTATDKKSDDVNMLVRNFVDFSCDCFDAWYNITRGGTVIGRIQNDNGAMLGRIFTHMIEDASAVFTYGSPEFNRLAARMLLRWIKIDKFDR